MTWDHRGSFPDFGFLTFVYPILLVIHGQQTFSGRRMLPQVAILGYSRFGLIFGTSNVIKIPGEEHVQCDLYDSPICIHHDVHCLIIIQYESFGGAGTGPDSLKCCFGAFSLACVLIP